jgi:glucose-6-phosphate 1-dehydrogenase
MNVVVSKRQDVDLYYNFLGDGQYISGEETGHISYYFEPLTALAAISRETHLSNQLNVFHVKWQQAPLVVQNNKKYVPFLLQIYIVKHIQLV